VLSTRVGYAGGKKVNPTYYSLGGHSESVEIVYDPSVISYQDLLEVFWQSHNPAAVPYSSQYMSIIFYYDEEQKRLAEETKANLEETTGRKMYTEIVPAGEFYPAEDYHQKYALRQYPVLVSEMEAIYPDPEDFVNSTAVARLNGYAGGYGNANSLEEELELLGLSEKGQEIVREIAGRGLTLACPVPG
jgi:peptide-methionine (S)-S-oxide reductase